MIAPAEIVVVSWGIRITLNFVTIVLYLRWLLNEGRNDHHSLSRMMTVPAEIVVASWGIRISLNFVAPHGRAPLALRPSRSVPASPSWAARSRCRGYAAAPVCSLLPPPSACVLYASVSRARAGRSLDATAHGHRAAQTPCGRLRGTVPVCLRLPPSLRSGREVRASSWRAIRISSLRSGADNTLRLARRSLLAGAPLPPNPRGSYVAATAGGFRFGASRVLALRAAECSLAPVAFSLSVCGSPSECAANVVPSSVGFCPRCRSLPSFVGFSLSALPRVLLLCVGLFAPDGARRNARLLRRGPRPALKSLGGSPAPSRFPRSLRSRPCDGAQGQGRAVSFATLRAYFSARALRVFLRPAPFARGGRGLRAAVAVCASLRSRPAAIASDRFPSLRLPSSRHSLPPAAPRPRYARPRAQSYPHMRFRLNCVFSKSRYIFGAYYPLSYALRKRLRFQKTECPTDS